MAFVTAMLSDANTVLLSITTVSHFPKSCQITEFVGVAENIEELRNVCYPKDYDGLDVGQPVFSSKYPSAFMELVLTMYKWENLLLNVSSFSLFLLASDSCFSLQ